MDKEIKKTIDILKNEYNCVKAAETCDRNCADCALVKPSQDILDAHSKAISCLYSIEQIKWERDKAMDQLKANGLRFCHKDDYGWIPCKERLPDNEELYQCTIRRFEDDFIQVEDLIFFPNYNIWNWLDDVELDSHTHEVLAWMPLPQPYIK